MQVESRRERLTRHGQALALALSASYRGPLAVLSAQMEIVFARDLGKLLAEWPEHPLFDAVHALLQDGDERTFDAGSDRLRLRRIAGDHAVVLVTVVDSPHAQALRSAQRLSLSLTPAEAQVMAALVCGGSNASIAHALFISPNLRTHVYRIFKKLGARSRTHAIALVLEG